MPSFDFYEYVGYIVPGSVLLVCLMSFCPWMRAMFTGGVAAEIGRFLIVTFLLGHFLHAVAHGVENLNQWSCEGGVYGENSLVTNPDGQNLLSKSERWKLHHKILGHFKVDINALNPLNQNANFITWCNITFRIQDSVHHDRRGALLDTFIKDYGLYLGLTTAFALVFLLCIPFILASAVSTDQTVNISFRTNRFIFIPLRRILFITGVAGIGGLLALYRLLYFGRLFTRELFLSFLAVPDPLGWIAPG
jgi:hypothetical protein